LRETIIKHKEILLQLEFLQEKVDRHDKEIIVIFEAIQRLVEPPVEEKPKRRIGFRHD